MIITTPFGNLALTATSDALTHCHWTPEKPNQKTHSAILKMAKEQLNAYFQWKLRQFSVSLFFEGTEFQKQVWKALQKIPFGKTQSYQEVADCIKHPNAMRAVGSANGKNPLCIFIPCHRVILASGKMGGYVGGSACKEKLLSLEKIGSVAKTVSFS